MSLPTPSWLGAVVLCRRPWGSASVGAVVEPRVPAAGDPQALGCALARAQGARGVVSAPSRQRVLPQVFPCMRPLRRGREMHLGLTPCPVGTVERLEKSGCSRAGAGQVNPSPREPSFRSAVVVTFASHVSPGLRGPGLSRVPAVGPGGSCWLRSAVGSSSCSGSVLAPLRGWPPVPHSCFCLLLQHPSPGLVSGCALSGTRSPPLLEGWGASPT